MGSPVDNLLWMALAGWLAAGGMGIKSKPGKLGLCLTKLLFWTAGWFGGLEKSTIGYSQASWAWVGPELGNDNKI